MRKLLTDNVVATQSEFVAALTGLSTGDVLYLETPVLLTTTVDIPAGVTILGQGRVTPIILDNDGDFGDGGNYAVFKLVDPLDNVIENITFECDGSNYNGTTEFYAVLLEPTSVNGYARHLANTLLKNLNFQNVKFGSIGIRQMDGVTVEGCYLEYNTPLSDQVINSPINVAVSDNVTIKNTTLRSTGAGQWFSAVFVGCASKRSSKSGNNYLDQNITSIGPWGGTIAGSYKGAKSFVAPGAGPYTLTVYQDSDADNYTIPDDYDLQIVPNDLSLGTTAAFQEGDCAFSTYTPVTGSPGSQVITVGGGGGAGSDTFWWDERLKLESTGWCHNITIADCEFYTDVDMEGHGAGVFLSGVVGFQGMRSKFTGWHDYNGFDCEWTVGGLVSDNLSIWPSDQASVSGGHAALFSCENITFSNNVMLCHNSTVAKGINLMGHGKFIRDIVIHGNQFVNASLAGTNNGTDDEIWVNIIVKDNVFRANLSDNCISFDSRDDGAIIGFEFSGNTFSGSPNFDIILTGGWINLLRVHDNNAGGSLGLLSMSWAPNYDPTAMVYNNIAPIMGSNSNAYVIAKLGTTPSSRYPLMWGNILLSSNQYELRVGNSTKTAETNMTRPLVWSSGKWLKGYNSTDVLS